MMGGRDVNPYDLKKGGDRKIGWRCKFCPFVSRYKGVVAHHVVKEHYEKIMTFKG